MSRVYDALNISKARDQGTAPPAGGEPEAGQHEYRRVPAAPREGGPVLPFQTADSRAAEQYRLVRARILQQQPERRLIAISSPDAGDGKTVTAINVAAVFALRGSENVLLVGADLRHADLTDQLGIPAEPGLADVLAGRCSLGEAVLAIEQFPRLHVLPAGKPNSSPTELFESEAWRRACQEMQQAFRIVILDTAPIGVVADYELVQRQCDGMILVAAPDHTVRKNLNSALRAIPGDKLLGVVLNNVRRWLFWRTPEYALRYVNGKTAPKAARAASGNHE